MRTGLWILIFALGIAYGAAFFFNAILLRELGPLWISAGRLLFGAAACWVFLIAIRRPIALTGRDIRKLVIFGVVSYAIPFSAFPIAQQYIASGATGIVNAMTPIMVVIISNFWPGGERATPLKSMGVAIGFVGILILSLPAMAPGQSNELFGIGIALIGPVCYAIALNIVRQLANIDAWVMVAASLTGGALAVATLAIFVEGAPGLATASGWASMLILGVVLTGFAFLAFFWALPQAGATNMSTVTFIAPISAVLLGTLILGEELGPAHFAGMAAIFAGLILIDGRLFRRNPQPSG